MKIKDWCADERPREKMLEKGAQALGTAELIAILLRTGTRGRNVVDVAHELLSLVDGSLTGASALSVEELCRIDGIGPGKAVSVKAALELGKRMCAERPYSAPRIIKGSSDVNREMYSVMHGLRHEEFWVLFLARNSRVISKERLSVGGLNETVVDVREVVRRAIDKRASSVVVAHNHPSGDPHPGTADIILTDNLRRALETFGIKLLDHLIYSDGMYYSFVDNGGTSIKEGG